mmetsp:Transcript_5791/g.17680  ORF Transcript_5791/g.17680 Transcript_5791/m.17680 type:complete len:216 (-) Transcript_5791:2871-3518(-)
MLRDVRPLPRLNSIATLSFSRPAASRCPTPTQPQQHHAACLSPLQPLQHHAARHPSSLSSTALSGGVQAASTTALPVRRLGHQHHRLAGQPSKLSSAATPRLIQCACGRALGSFTSHTKFVEWPVVDSVPRRSLVLYSGHTYTSALASMSDASLGWKSIVGRGENRTLGAGSASSWLSASNDAASRNMPRTRTPSSGRSCRAAPSLATPPSPCTA